MREGSYTLPDGRKVQFSDGDTLRDVADLWAVLQGEYKGTESASSDALKTMLGHLQSGAPLSGAEWEQLNRIRSRFGDQLKAFRASPDNDTEGFVPLQDPDGAKMTEAALWAPGMLSRLCEQYATPSTTEKDKGGTAAHLADSVLHDLAHTRQHIARILEPDVQASPQSVAFNAEHALNHAESAQDHAHRLDKHLSKEPSDPALWTAERKALNKMREAEQTGTGAMVALYPSPDVARALAQKGGEDPDQIHLTLAYLGPAAGITDAAGLRNAVGRWASKTPVMSGEVSGTGTFTAGSQPVAYASADVPPLPEARQQLVEALQRAGFPPSEAHGFTPHLTLAYSPDSEPDTANHPLTFDHAALVLGSERWDFPLSGIDQPSTRLMLESAEVMTRLGGATMRAPSNLATGWWKFESPAADWPQRQRVLREATVQTEQVAADPEHPQLHKPTLAVDFDGVIHIGGHGMPGEVEGQMSDGCAQALKQLSERYRLVVFTARQDFAAVRRWLVTQKISDLIDDVSNVKPQALAYIDDRAIHFGGDWKPVLTAADPAKSTTQPVEVKRVFESAALLGKVLV